MNGNHTPEPWAMWDHGLDELCVHASERRDEHVVAVLDAEGLWAWQSIGRRRADAARIVACVNACAGMDDPAAEIAAMKADIETLVEAANVEATENERLHAQVRALSCCLDDALAFIATCKESEGWCSRTTPDFVVAGTAAVIEARQP